MESNLVITQENLVIRESNHQRHLAIWRDTDGREYVFVNSFTPTPIEKIQGATRRETRS